MNIVFVEPAFPQNQRRFVAALAGVGARVVGVGESPEDELGDELRGQLAAYYQVGNVTDVHQLDEAVQWAQDQMWVDRLESTIESHQMAAAEVREARGIPGTSLAHDLAVPRQAVDEGGAAPGRRTDRRLDRGRQRRVRCGRSPSTSASR